MKIITCTSISETESTNVYFIQMLSIIRRFIRIVLLQDCSSAKIDKGNNIFHHFHYFK